MLDGLVGFTAALTAAGVPVTTDRTTAYVAAVGEVDVADADQLYWAGRLTLCSDPDDFDTYEQVFRRWFLRERPARGAPKAAFRASNAMNVAFTAPLTPTRTDDADRDGMHAVGASDAEVLRHRDLGELSPAERAHLRELLALLRPEPPLRRSVRRRPARRGQLDPRRTVRRMLATGGEPAALAYRRRAAKPRKVVLLVDVSGSMQPYADALLRFAHAVVRRTPGAVEVYTLGTRLTRVTRQLRLRDPEHALAAAARAVPDYAGGTRLGETVQAFLDRWGQRGAARAAVVVVFSDGWERGDPALLAEQLARLKRLAHSVLWVNPHAAKDGYLPVQSGIVAALPHIDRLLSGHSLSTLDELLQVMRDARRTG